MRVLTASYPRDRHVRLRFGVLTRSERAVRTDIVRVVECAYEALLEPRRDACVGSTLRTHGAQHSVQQLEALVLEHAEVDHAVVLGSRQPPDARWGERGNMEHGIENSILNHQGRRRSETRAT